MEEFNIQGKQISFYKYCPGTLDTHLYLKQERRFETNSLQSFLSASLFVFSWRIRTSALFPNRI